MILAALAAASIATGDSQSPADCAGALCGIHALAPFFDALQTRAGFEGAPPVHILQLGDSHSAGDAISGAWRDILQARYGSGGRGVLPPGDPYWGFLPHGVHVTQSDGWRVEATFGKAAPPADYPVTFGVSGFRMTAMSPQARFDLTADPSQAFDRTVVCGESGPAAGGYAVTLAGVTTHVSLAGIAGVACQTFTAPSLQTSVGIVAEQTPVTLLSWGVFRGGGVVVSNLGVVGAQLRHFARAGDAAIGVELRAYAPDLIVVEFGTNEGFGGHFDAAGYDLLLRSQIARLRRLSGGAAILVLGAPDAGSRNPELAHNADPAGPDPGPLARTSDGWFSPPALAQARTIQKRVALEMGAAFWDWAQAEGGVGTSDDWPYRVPPLMRGDHIHYTAAGGAEIAQRLQADLDQAAQALAAGGAR